MKKPLQNTSPRLQRMLLSLQKYDNDLVYLAGQKKILAETLSRAHLEETTEEIAEGELEAQDHIVYENAPATNVKMKEIREEIAKDSSLMEIVRCYRRMASEKRSIIGKCKAVLVIQGRTAHSMQQKHLKSLQKIGVSNTYQTALNIQDQMNWQKKHFKQ